MQTSQPSVFARDHTLLGVCEALGEDLGFSPVLLRIAFSLGLFFSPAGTLALYAGLGILVAFTRFVAPNPWRAIPDESPAAEQAPRQAEDDDDRSMALAA